MVVDGQNQTLATHSKHCDRIGQNVIDHKVHGTERKQKKCSSVKAQRQPLIAHTK